MTNYHNELEREEKKCLQKHFYLYLWQTQGYKASTRFIHDKIHQITQPPNVSRLKPWREKAMMTIMSPLCMPIMQKIKKVNEEGRGKDMCNRLCNNIIKTKLLSSVKWNTHRFNKIESCEKNEWIQGLYSNTGFLH